MLTTKWRSELSGKLFKTEDGAFVLPYIANNAQLMFESVAQIPGVKVSPLKNSIESGEQIALGGTLKSINLDEGLICLASSVTIFKDIIAKAEYIDTNEIPHYFLSFSVFNYQYPTNVNQTSFAKLSSITCTFNKPCTGVNTFFYANTTGVFFNIGFTKKWVLQNINTSQPAVLQACLNNETGFLNWLNIVPLAEERAKDIWLMMGKTPPPVIELRELICSIIQDFFELAMTSGRLQNMPRINNDDFAKLSIADRMIMRNLSNFAGVDLIAKESGLSATKLKALFKTVYGFSMFQYFKEKNMLLAEQLVKESAMQIQQIATLTGYQSVSKFIAAFKKRFGAQPGTYRVK